MTHNVKEENKNKKISRKRLVTFWSVLFSFLVVGLVWGFVSLRSIWQDQCVIRDVDFDVEIHVIPGTMVMPDVITLSFGLTNGANLATIPFEEKRENLLKRFPNIAKLTIERTQPNHVAINVVERLPVARLMYSDEKTPTKVTKSSLVVGEDGVAFCFTRNTDELPAIVQDANHRTGIGEKLSGMSKAALALIQTASLSDFEGMEVLEVNACSKYNLFCYFANLDMAKIVWKKMIEDTAASRESLRKQLLCLRQLMFNDLTPQNTLWIVKLTEDEKPSVYASRPKLNKLSLYSNK